VNTVTAVMTPHDSTVGDLLRLGERRLTASDSPRLDAEVLLAAARRCSRADLFRDRDESPGMEVTGRFLQWLAERAHGVPVAYLIGRREFWSLDLEVTPATLIPRPETELLVELALTIVPETGPFRIADLGTGSGAIALAIARERPAAQVIATDVCEAALAVAARNAARSSIGNVSFRAGSWMAPLGDERFDLIVSNPPYVGERDPHLQIGDVRFEPSGALQSGADGLDAIRQIVSNGIVHLLPGGRLVLEHGAIQGDAVRYLLTASGYVDVGTCRDLGGRERATFGRRPRSDA
jgi:release factor glutamine methyltransferase